MAGQFQNKTTYEAGGSTIETWLVHHFDKAVFQGDNEVFALSMAGDLAATPRKKCCVVFRDFERCKYGWRATPVGLFPMREAMEVAFGSGNAYIRPMDVCVPLGDPDYTNEATLTVLKQCARQWVSGGANNTALDLTHVATMLFTAAQCVSYRMSTTPALLSAFVGLVRSLTLGCHALEPFRKIASTLATGSFGIADMTQKALARKLTSPPTPFDRETQMLDLCEMMRRHRKKSGTQDENVANAPGIVGIFLLIEAEAQRIVDTVLDPLESGVVGAMRARFTARCAELAASKDPITSLTILTDMAGSPLSRDRAADFMGWFHGAGRDPKVAPPLEELGLIPPKAKIDWLHASYFVVGAGEAKALPVLVKPRSPTQALVQLVDIPEWGGVSLCRSGLYRVTPTNRGLSEAREGDTRGVPQTANLRVTAGPTQRANLQCPLVSPDCYWSYSAAGMLVEPDGAKWKYTNRAKADPTAAFGLGGPFEVRVKMDETLTITKAGREFVTFPIRGVSPPFLAFKFMDAVIDFEAAPEAPAKPASWAEAMLLAESKAEA